MSKATQEAKAAAKAAAKEEKKAKKTVKSESEVLMLTSVMHDGVLYKRGERATLTADVFSLFVERGQATAVEVAESGENQNANTQPQVSDATGDAQTGEGTDANAPAPTGDAAQGSDANGSDAKTGE